ncbi:neuropeptide Y receptor type 1-like [Littorina saxatilis]|uniref:neuropeptide Y receptor type 1-like n=1 Tax=Littorina saxatilis TaxID=31220 RepID=UPI0038B6693A
MASALLLNNSPTPMPPSPITTITTNSPAITTSNNTNISDYDYDYDLTDYNVPLEELIPVTIVYGATLILGLSGNLLVIVVVARYRTMKNITNTFLLSLASADLLLVSICIPVKFAAFFTFSWTFGEFLCKAMSYLQNVSALCSVFTLTAMSLESPAALSVTSVAN